MQCSSTTSGTPATTFTSTFLNLRMGGLVIDPNVPPNRTIALPNPGGGLILVIINERTTASDSNDTEGTINAVHAYVLDDSAVLNAELIVASAHCDAHKA